MVTLSTGYNCSDAIHFYQHHATGACQMPSTALDAGSWRWQSHCSWPRRSFSWWLLDKETPCGRQNLRWDTGRRQLCHGGPMSVGISAGCWNRNRKSGQAAAACGMITSAICGSAQRSRFTSYDLKHLAIILKNFNPVILTAYCCFYTDMCAKHPISYYVLSQAVLRQIFECPLCALGMWRWTRQTTFLVSWGLTLEQQRQLTSN